MGRGGTRVVDDSRTTYTVTGIGRDELDAVVAFAHDVGVDISVWPHGSSKYAYSYTVDHPKVNEPSKPADCCGCCDGLMCQRCIKARYEANSRPFATWSEASKALHQAENEAMASSLRRYADSIDRRGVVQ